MSSGYTKYVKLSTKMNYLHKPINQFCSHAGIDVLLNFVHEVCGRPFLCLKFPGIKQIRKIQTMGNKI